MTQRHDSNNYVIHSSPPELNPEPDIFTSTSLKNSKDKDTLLRSIGYLCGIQVDDNNGPKRLTRQVARSLGVNPPFVQETNDFFTENIATTTERDTNYVHQGWSIDATSTISPWTLSRTITQNGPNNSGAWITRRTVIKRLSVQVSLTDLVPTSEFQDEIEVALSQPTVFQQFRAVYRTFHKWGDVVPLEIDMGISLTFTDLESNISQLPATANWRDTYYLMTIRTGRTTRQDGNNSANWGKEVWPSMSYTSPLTWRQIRITKVAPTIELLPPKIQERLLELYAKRLSYVPAITIGPGDSSSKTYEDTPHATKQISSVTVYTSDWIRSMRFTYADKTCSIKHEGTEGYGAVHEFKLVEGEYITEMIIWHSQQQYIGGLQFITNLGRCSPHLGGGEIQVTPTIARSKGGVLVGVISLLKRHDLGYLFSKIQGIWRHDVFDRVPKECDVFSDYYGSKDGRPFNDRVVVRNSDIAISQIEVWSAGAIDSIQFTYVDSKNKAGSRILSDRHGGMGGSKKAPFVLGSGEHIFGISGRHDNSRITQLTFITNRGRTSDVFGVGQSTGESQSFSVSSPEDHEGNRMRLQYICGKCDTFLNGVVFAWTPL